MKAYQLLSDPGAWTQGADARNAAGYSVNFNAPDAAQWCAVGALIRCYPDHWKQIVDDIWEKECEINQSPFGHSMGLTAWNDESHRTQADVVELLRRHDL